MRKASSVAATRAALLGRLDLVALGQHHRVGDGRGVEQPHRLAVALLEPMPPVDEQEDPHQRRPAAQIVAHEPPPGGRLALATAA